MGELRLGRIVTKTKGRGTKRQGTEISCIGEYLALENILQRK